MIKNCTGEIGTENKENKMTTATKTESRKVGCKFIVKTSDGLRSMTCTEHTEERIVFKCVDGVIELDWMEYIDQASLGRIEQVTFKWLK